MILSCSLDRKWAKSRVEQIKGYFKETNKNVEIIVSDSREEIRTASGHSLGGAMAIAIGRVAGMINKTKVKKDKRGQ